MPRNPAPKLDGVAEERRDLRWQAYQDLRAEDVARGDTAGLAALDHIMRKEAKRRNGDGGSAG